MDITFTRQTCCSSSVSTQPLRHSQPFSLCSSRSTACINKRRASSLRPSLRAGTRSFMSVSTVASGLLSIQVNPRLGGLQFGVMRILHHHSFTIKELSNKMTLSAAALVPVIDSLEREGLATRGHDPADRRRTPLTLTPKGRDLIAGLPIIAPDDA